MPGIFDDDVSDINERNVYNFRPECGISCSRCNKCNSPKLSILAKKEHGYMFIAGEPTKSQDNAHNVWTGSYKAILLPLLQKYKVDMDSVSFVFAVSCNGDSMQNLDNRAFYLTMDSCESLLLSNIEKANPDVLIPLDYVAWEALTRHHLTGRIEKASYNDDFVFNLIPDQTLNRWVAPIMSPLLLNGMFQDRKKQDDYDFYVRKTKRFLKKVFTEKHSFPYYSTSVTVCDNLEMACFALTSILEQKPCFLAFDFETEGLKLERSDVDIVCVGIAYNDIAISMPFYKEQRFRDLFNQIMQDTAIGKIAHHAKYEARCCLNKLGACPEPWAWDSMYGARIINNKTKCGLKPQTYVNFGIAGYDVIENYFKSESTEEEIKYGENARNRLQKAFDNDPDVRSKALTYVGQDALFTLRLALKQMEIVAEDNYVQKGEKLLRSYINPLVTAEVNGMTIDKLKVRDNIEECNSILETQQKLIAEDELVKKWDGASPFDYNKSTDLAHLIYDIGGMPKEYTDKGQLALDSATLELMPLELTDKILESRRITKIRDTYLTNLKKEAVKDNKTGDYKIHVNFNLHVATTFRSSSSGGINLQNIPSHDKRAIDLIKSCIVPPSGMYILGGDYSSLEIGIGCSLHHDKNMTKFLLEGGDMHRATTKDIYFLDDATVDSMDKKVWKELRQIGKRGNFLLMYGGGAKLLSSIVWKDALHNKERMKKFTDNGIRGYDDFAKHIQDVYDGFWNVQFPEYGQWSRGVYEFYQKHGYVELPAGFKCYGPMTAMQASNAPVQGSAAQLALFAGANITRELQERKLQSHIVDYIHDALYTCTNDTELETVLALMKKWMIDEARNEFPWISVPLFVDTERSEYRENDGNWSQEIEIRRLS